MAFRKVLGLDILPGSSPEKGEPAFACVLVSEGRVVGRWEGLSRGEALALAAQQGAEAIAVDNLGELGSEEEIAKLLKVLPASLKLVEVTRVAGERLSVEALCALTGLRGGKLSPLETAEVAALLAYHGVGSEVLLFEEETLIKVGRGRVPGPGGMSRERFKRGIELLVKRKVSEIREALERAGLDYDLFARKSGEGLTGATFVVYAPREALAGVVRRESGHDLFVEIEPVKRERVEYRPLTSKSARRAWRSERVLIVGVDPGTTTGVAALDLKGSVVALFSKRLLGRSQLTRALSELGRPAVVATDVQPPPSYVRKLASSLGAVLFAPPRPLSLDEKRRLAGEASSLSGVKVRDSHQRDALAAAYKAFLSYREKFEEVEREAERRALPVPLDEAKLLVLRGEPVASAVVKAAGKYLGLEPRAEVERLPAEGAEHALEFYKALVEQLAADNHALRRELREVREELEEKAAALERLLSARSSLGARDGALVKLEARIDMMSRELQEAREKQAELERRASSLAVMLREIVLGSKCAALKLSAALELLERGEFNPASLLDPVIFVDKEWPRDQLREALIRVKDPSRPLVAVVRASPPGDLSESLPLGVVAVPLSALPSAREVELFLAVDRSELQAAVEQLGARSVADKLRKALEDYRRRRASELFRRA
ncbi:MAG: DUF460 domain-containing protein [Thermofilum sp.]